MTFNFQRTSPDNYRVYSDGIDIGTVHRERWSRHGRVGPTTDTLWRAGDSDHSYDTRKEAAEELFNRFTHPYR